MQTKELRTLNAKRNLLGKGECILDSGGRLRTLFPGRDGKFHIPREAGVLGTNCIQFDEKGRLKIRSNIVWLEPGFLRTGCEVDIELEDVSFEVVYLLLLHIPAYCNIAKISGETEAAVAAGVMFFIGTFNRRYTELIMKEDGSKRGLSRWKFNADKFSEISFMKTGLDFCEMINHDNAFKVREIIECKMETRFVKDNLGFMFDLKDYDNLLMELFG
ncbi:MAG: hypothetical protein LBM93_05960 [Oscillospiraceae bacterium]|jgi:hypothetical protein|nr:hypothetical protein [Oscillospiraceae bacterium]